MNKRQRKKLLYKAIRELNDLVLEEGQSSTKEEVRYIYNLIKDDKKEVERTIRYYRM